MSAVGVSTGYNILISGAAAPALDAHRGPHYSTRSTCGAHSFRVSIAEQHMSVAKITEIQASSNKSFDDAIQAGLSRANKTLRNVTGAWIKSQKVMVDNGKIIEYRVLMKVSFILQDK